MLNKIKKKDMAIEYYKCECCEQQYFYRRQIPKSVLICSSCGWEKEVFPEGMRFLSAGVPDFFKKTFVRIPALLMSCILDGAI